MSRRSITVVAVLAVFLTMVAVLGVGAGRETASAPTVDAPAVPTPIPADPPAAPEPTPASSTPSSSAPGNGTASTTTQTPTAPPDYDSDGIPDDRDVCPTRPETVNGFQDGDGCPDVVTTTGAS